MRKLLLICYLALTCLGCFSGGKRNNAGHIVAEENEALHKIHPEILFVSFKDPGNAGIFYALSKNGLIFEALNGAEPVLRTSDSIAKMRDPFLVRDPEQGYHMVWTTGLKKIGYAWSPDLLDWSEQRILPLDAENDSVTNTWAPELVWDEDRGEWLIFYSSTVLGEFPETRGQVRNRRNHRIYAARTRDFCEISESRLFFDPGYPVIDATILKDEGRYLMVFKDERDQPLRKQLRTAVATSLEGPWTEVSDTLTASWSEGPTLLSRGGEYLLYYDFYKEPKHMGLLLSEDFRQWEDLSEQTSFPERFKHGAFLELRPEETRRLRQHYDTAEW